MDPYEDIDSLIDRRISQRMRLPGIIGRKPAAHPPLPPKEEKSVLSSVLGSGISGLQYLGETLDKPGRAIRGLLGGKPAELANLIPFSDTMGITDPSKSVSGRDLLEKAGVLGANTPGLDLGDVAGFGVEVVTDPLSYLTGGASAIGKAGKVAKALGISTKGAARFKTLGEHLVGAAPELLKSAENAAVKHGSTLAELSGEKLGGAFGLTTGPLGLAGIKGTYVPEIAKGPAAQAAIEGLGRASAAIGRTKPALGLKGLFDYSVRGQFTPAGQELGRAQTAAIERMRPEAIKPWAKLAGDLGEIQEAYTQSFGKNPLPPDLAPAFEKLARMHAEGVSSPAAFEFHNLPFHKPTSEALVKATQEFGAAKDKLWNQFLELGGDSASLHETEALKHSPRYPHPKGEEALAKGQYRGGSFDSAKGRLLPTKFLPADVINAIYKDPDVAAWTKSLSSKTGKEFSLGEGIRTADIPGMLEGWKGLGTATPVGHADLADTLLKKYGKWLNDAAVAEGTGPTEVAKSLAEHLTGRNKAVQFFNSTGADLYGRFGPDSYKYMTEAARKVAQMSAIHDTIKNSLVPGGVNPAVLFKDTKMNPVAAMQKLGPIAPGMGVAPDVANAILSVTEKSGNPTWLQHIGNFIDDVTKPFKQNVTLPWPSFLVRNHSSGQWMNLASNEIGSIGDVAKYAKEYRSAMGVLKNPAANRNFLEELAAHKVFDPEDLAAMGTELGWDVKKIPNPVSGSGVIQNFRQGIAKAKDLAFSPQGPIGQALPKPAKVMRAALAAPSQIGAEFNRQVEFLNRVPMYTYLRKHMGWTPEAAAAKVRELQVDYSALAPFEKTVMRRLAPFYTWSRKIMPEIFGQVAHRPGGVTAQTIRASDTGRSKDEFVPPYVGEGMSVNLGGDKYLSGLGLPTDQLADLFVKGPTALGTIKRTGQKMLSQMNPYVKAPIELATGTNTFTGRPLEEAYPHPTGNVLLNHLIHNSPIARLTTSERQLEDLLGPTGRKGPLSVAANLLTGAHITDVSGGLEKERSRAESKMLQEMLREDPNIGVSTDVYQKRDFATGQPKPLSPETEQRYRALMGIKRRAAEEAKRKKRHPASIP